MHRCPSEGPGCALRFASCILQRRFPESTSASPLKQARDPDTAAFQPCQTRTIIRASLRALKDRSPLCSGSFTLCSSTACLCSSPFPMLDGLSRCPGRCIGNARSTCPEEARSRNRDYRAFVLGAYPTTVMLHTWQTKTAQAAIDRACIVQYAKCPASTLCLTPSRGQ